MKTFKYFVSFLGAILLVSQSVCAFDGKVDAENPVFFRADKITYDKVLNRVIAEGHVEITQGKDFVSADRLIYSYDTEHIVADGNVLVRRPDNTQFTAVYVDLSRDLSEGLARQIRVRMEQETRIAAYEGFITPDKRKVFHYGVYSPCLICKEKPSKPPLWQIKARRFIHDEAKGEIIYHHAFFEFMGTPIFYTPYFEHPDSRRERSSGFLRPDFKTSTDTGVTFYIPYYFALGDDREMLVTPIISTSDRYLLRHQYRHVFAKGELEFDSSGGYINDDKISLYPKMDPNDFSNKLGGHLFWKARWHATDVWRISGDLQCTGQKTYLKRYNISQVDVLKSNLQAEGFWERDYFTQSFYGYQGLRTVDNHSETPRLLPEIAYFMDRDIWDGTFRHTMYYRNFRRDLGLVHQLVSNHGEWNRTEILPIGVKLKARPGYRVDFYDIEHHRIPFNPTQFKGRHTRAYGDLALIASYPFLGANDCANFVIEPTIGYMASPFQQNSSHIPNEDSQNFEFTETKFFTPNLFAGYDRISGGQRLDYAVFFDGSINTANLISGMVGQIYQFTDTKDFPKGSGLDRKSSDYIGRVNFDPSSFYKLSYRFRFDPTSKILKRSETGISFGPERIRLTVSHILLRDSDFEKTFHQQQQLTESAVLTINEYWKVNAGAIHDLGQTKLRRHGQKEQNLLNFSCGAFYEDECFLANLQMTRHFTRNQNLPARNEFLFTIGLKAFAQKMQQTFGSQTFSPIFNNEKKPT